MPGLKCGCECEPGGACIPPCRCPLQFNCPTSNETANNDNATLRPIILRISKGKGTETGRRGDKEKRKMCPILSPSPRRLLLLHKFQRSRIDAVAQAGRLRPVIEDVAEMRATAAAHHLDAAHAITVILFSLDVLFHHRLPKTGPARARIELGLRTEQLLRATGAYVDAFLVVIPEFAREGALGPLLAHHLKLQRRQYLRPFLIGLDDLFDLLRFHFLSILPFHFRCLFG